MIRKIKASIVLFVVAFLLPASLMAQENDLRLNIGIALGKYGKFDHNFSGLMRVIHLPLLFNSKKIGEKI